MTKKQSDGQAIPNQALQNIYFFVVESFWDPTTVLGQQKIENPIDTQFRALQEKHGKFHAVVPDFSGGTAHSEFEILCGLPVNIFYPIFKFALNDKLDCLPRVQSKLGYKTMAIHPGHRTMWNRDKTYKKIGFENYFAGDTIIGNSGQNIDAFYRDENFLKYALDFVKHKNSERKKNFFYFLTMGLHYPFYNLGGTKDPKFNSDNPYLSKYLESVAVTTKHLARTIAQIQTLDPEGIIVIAGDHLPHKINPELFSVNGDDLRAFNTSDISNFSTPLVLINLPKPRKNYVRLTELAGLVFRKLKLPPGQYTSDLPMSLPEANYLYDFTFDSVTGAAVDCNRSTTGCDQFYIMKKNYQIIMDDFLFGKQLGLKILENKVLHQ